MHTYENNVYDFEQKLSSLVVFYYLKKKHQCCISTTSAFASLTLFFVDMQTGWHFSTSLNSSPLYFIEFLPHTSEMEKWHMFPLCNGSHEMNLYWLRFALDSFYCRRWLLHARRLQNTNHKLGFVWLLCLCGIFSLWPVDCYNKHLWKTMKTCWSCVSATCNLMSS